MWIVCLADDSHEISRLIIFENYKKKKKIVKMSSAAVFLGALRVNNVFIYIKKKNQCSIRFLTNIYQYIKIHEGL